MTLGKLLFVTAIPLLGFCLHPLEAAPGSSRSIRSWATCDGRTDDSQAAAKAFSAAKNGAFTLLVDCPVFIHVASDIARPIFIEDGTTVQFSGSGLFIVDNILIPSFVIANSSGIQMINWRVQYAGGIPVDILTGAFTRNGVRVPSPAKDPPAVYFNDEVLTQWLSAKKGIVFSRSDGRVTSPWTGPTNTAAIFFLIGSASNITVRGMRLFVPPSTPGNKFIPMCFSGRVGFKSNQVVTAKTPLTSDAAAVPTKLTFTDIELDGYYMGWQGEFQDAVWTHIRGRRYGDLQDANGGTVGGVAKWFAPPHLFYLNFDPKQTGLEVRNVRVTDVIDAGDRIGVARDTNPAEPLSGYANSLKIGGINVTVDQYKSNRPDGVADILTGQNMKFSNIDGTYDSSFINHLYPGGIRFPAVGTGYKKMVIENVNLTDKSPETVKPPVSGNNEGSNEQIEMKNVNVVVNKWAASGPPRTPAFAGANHQIGVGYKAVNSPGDPAK